MNPQMSTRGPGRPKKLTKKKEFGEKIERRWSPAETSLLKEFYSKYGADIDKLASGKTVTVFFLLNLKNFQTTTSGHPFP